jgi:hypothetical protein
MFIQQIVDRLSVEITIGLYPRTPDSRSLAAVEHAAMQRSTIGSPGHQAIENIEFANEVTFADAADRRVAAHLPRVFRTEA